MNLQEQKNIQISIERVDKDLELPEFAHESDAGLDLRSSQDEMLMPGEKKIIKTGIKIAIPEGYVGLIWDRSGMAAKYSMHTMAGVIDSGYRGEVGIVIINLGTEDFYIEKGMRIAQMVIQPVLNTKVVEVKSLSEDETQRGAGGFGSSGLN